jgi:hypothetical protein
MRLTVALALLFSGFAGAAHAGQAHTTRIETRPYYGAVVTIEQGVRVYRPVPPTTHMIINPDGATPLEIDVGDGAHVRRPAAETTR